MRLFSNYTFALDVSPIRAIALLSLIFMTALVPIKVNAQSSSVAYPTTPFISPAAGTYSSGQTVTISDGTPGTTIHYTTDGSVPTAKSLEYTEPIVLPTAKLTETIRAVAVNEAYTGSSASSTFVIVPQLPKPSFSIAGGYYMGTQSVSIATSSSLGGLIYFTVDGSTPTTSSQVYDGTPIQFAAKTKIEAIVAGVANYAQSTIASQTYYILPATPWISPSAGTYTIGQTVKIADTTPGVTIYYTTDGTAPTTASAQYTGPISIPTEPVTETIKAFAVLEGVDGGEATSTYTISPYPVAPSPAISPASGSFTTNQLVTLTDSLAGARVYYTLDGSTPTTGSTPYVAPFYIPAGQTGVVVIKAIASKTGFTSSAVSQATITLDLPAGTIASTVVVSPTPIVKIPTDFLGFSHGWGVAETLMGDKANGVNTIYRTLVNTLTHQMGGPLILRIGGGNTDISGPADAATVEPFIELAQAANVKFILGVNLGSNNLQLAEQQASIFSTLPSGALEALEIGNEPDGYASDGYRPTGYDWSDYLPQYLQWQQGVSSVTPTPIPIAGPVLGGDGWIANAEGNEASTSFPASMITQHFYVGCYYAGDPLPTDILLQPASATGGPSALQPYVAATHRLNIPFRLAEMNSICNGGQPGVSNTFSSALWAIDTMFEFAKVGVDGVNWGSNFDDGPYDLFHFSSPTDGKYYLSQVQPLYYGLLFFAESAGNSAQLLSTSTLTSGNVKVWATVDDTGHAHLVVINKEVSLSGNVKFTLPGYTSGTVTTLQGANYQATSGVTIAGQTYDGSQDGTLQGSASNTTIYPVDGVWTIPVSAMSAVTVNLQP